MAIRISGAWEAAWSFARREAALWLPIALACWGLPAMISVGPQPSAADLSAGRVDPSYLAVLLVAGLAALFGQLALAALVLHLGGSVGEALRAAARRYPGALGTVLLLGVGFAVYVMIAAVIALLVGGMPVQAAGGTATFGSGTILMLLVLMLPAAVLTFRLGTLWPMVMDRGEAGWPAVLATLRATAPVVWRLALLWIVYSLAVALGLVAVNLGLGSLARLAALATGSDQPWAAALSVVLAGAGAVGSGMWALFLAHLHRQLAPASLSTIFE